MFVNKEKILCVEVSMGIARVRSCCIPEVRSRQETQCKYSLFQSLSIFN